MHLWSFLVSLTACVSGAFCFCLGYAVCYYTARRRPRPLPPLDTERADRFVDAAQAWWPAGTATVQREVGYREAPEVRRVHVRSHWRRVPE